MFNFYRVGLAINLLIVGALAYMSATKGGWWWLATAIITLWVAVDIVKINQLVKEGRVDWYILAAMKGNTIINKAFSKITRRG